MSARRVFVLVLFARYLSDSEIRTSVRRNRVYRHGKHVIT